MEVLNLTEREFDALKEFLKMNEFNSKRLGTNREIAYTLTVNEIEGNPWMTFEELEKHIQAMKESPMYARYHVEKIYESLLANNYRSFAISSQTAMLNPTYPKSNL